MLIDDVRRTPLGTFTRPTEETGGAPRGEVVNGYLVRHDAGYVLLDGESEPLSGIHVVPTPGHVDGHQSLVVECADGSVVLAGQSHEHASDWSSADPSGWLARLLSFDPRRVVFAHDDEEWRP